MNLVARQNFGYRGNTGTNTEIGGVAAVIYTPALLASKLGISESRISKFAIVGSDIKCRIEGSYSPPSNAFNVRDGYFPNIMTYYRDLDNLLYSMNYYTFDSCTLLTDLQIKGLTYINLTGLQNFFNLQVKEFYFPNLLGISGNNNFRDCSNTTVFYLPNCLTFGSSPSVNDNNFFNIGSGKKIYAHASMATINAGGVEADLAAAIAAGNIVRYVTNFTVPNPITDLSAGTIYNTAIQLNFTTPSSTNAIDYYELYNNGVFVKNITASGQYLTSLTPSTNYNITLIAVDVFYNKSVVSNSLSVSTSNRSAVDTDAIAYVSASSNTNYQDIIDDMFISLKSNSLYTKLQAFYPFLGTTQAQHKWNAKNPLDTDVAFRLVFTGSPTFSDNGYLTGGGHANTFLIPNSVQNVNSNGLTVVVGTNNSANTNDTAIGAFGSGSNASWIVVKLNNSNFLRELRMNFAAIQQTSVNEARGIWTGTRQSSTVSKFFRNSSSIGSVAATGTLPTYSIWIGALNNNGSAYGSTSQRIQFVAIHEGLTDTEVATLHTIIDTFETAIGRKTW